MRRAMRGFPVFRPDAEHIHHRLQRLGFSERRLVITMYLLTVFLSLMALSVFWSQGRTLPIALGMLFLLIVVAVRYLGYIWSWGDLAAQIQKSMERRCEVRYVLACARLAELDVERFEKRSSFERSLAYLLEQCGFMAVAPLAGDEYQKVELKFKGLNRPWYLWVKSERIDNDHHVRRAECFREAYLKACAKWEVQALTFNEKTERLSS